jgi:hypothetical protein
LTDFEKLKKRRKIRKKVLTKRPPNAILIKHFGAALLSKRKQRKKLKNLKKVVDKLK